MQRSVEQQAEREEVADWTLVSAPNTTKPGSPDDGIPWQQLWISFCYQLTTLSCHVAA